MHPKEHYHTSPVVPVSMLKSSLLTGKILSFIAPKALMLPLSQPIPIHPLFMIGFSGLISSALNLLPIFRLDGGRGNHIGGLASAGTLLFSLHSRLLSPGAWVSHLHLACLLSSSSAVRKSL
jgi:hypothetical protein